MDRAVWTHSARRRGLFEPAAGYEAGEGFVKLPYDRELPTDLLKALMQARVDEYQATAAGWNDR